MILGSQMHLFTLDFCRVEEVVCVYSIYVVLVLLVIDDSLSDFNCI